jgi:uncharacterized membrane protein YfcA
MNDSANDDSSRRWTVTKRSFSVVPLAVSAAWLVTMALRSSNAITDTDAHDNRLLSVLMDEDSQISSLFPLTPLDYFGFTCTIVGLILAAGAGIGGGGILVPIYILIFEFPLKHAIPLASVTVFGGAIANNLLNARKSHPDHPGRPVIDWELILQLEPMTMAGALIGADLNDLLPDVVLVVLLFLLLSITSYKTLNTAKKMYEKESKEICHQIQDESETLLESSKNNKGIDEEEAAQTTSYGSNGGSHTTPALDTGKKPSFGEDQSHHQSWVDILKLISLFAVVTGLNLLKGAPGKAGGGPFGLESCDATCFWTTELAMLVVILSFVFHVRSGVLRRVKTGGPLLSEIEWDEENTVTYPLLAIVAGLVAGMFGVGGGIIKGPLMLALGT